MLGTMGPTWRCQFRPATRVTSEGAQRASPPGRCRHDISFVKTLSRGRRRANDCCAPIPNSRRRSTGRPSSYRQASKDSRSPVRSSIPFLPTRPRAAFSGVSRRSWLRRCKRGCVPSLRSGAARSSRLLRRMRPRLAQPKNDGGKHARAGGLLGGRLRRFPLIHQGQLGADQVSG
jgi:hypothetical protein